VIRYSQYGEHIEEASKDGRGSDTNAVFMPIRLCLKASGSLQELDPLHLVDDPLQTAMQQSITSFSV
jgi:hypothetical protein